MRRSIMFVADDLGSLILKDALVTAIASRERSWLDIVDRTRALVFRGCPHRSADQREMEDKIAEFVFTAGVNAFYPVVRPTLAAMPGLAEAVIHTNGRFILAKINMKCSLISVHHSSRHVARDSSGVSKPLPL
ncbi:hypothetical protein FJTKL_06059 [Diaporthe vaccinii]|uniref:Uncharacterized protein n=1 Tax=Diaporthe vaccinii TaxID=105482 RepID=A0ABR4EXP6_9PEZI